jgi:hypothetical protein
MVGNGSVLTGLGSVNVATTRPSSPTTNAVWELTTAPSIANGSNYAFRFTGWQQTVNYKTSAWILYGSLEDTVQKQLEAIFGVGNTRVTRNDDAAPIFRYEITFVGALAGKNYDFASIIPGHSYSYYAGGPVYHDDLLEELKSPYKLTFTEAANNDGIVPQDVLVYQAVQGSPNKVGEMQVVSLGNNPTGGNFTLTFKTSNSATAQTTEPIQHDASDYDVWYALSRLSNTGSGSNVTVAGNSGGPWTVTFSLGLSGIDVPQMTGSGRQLLGGTVNVTTTQQAPAVNGVQEIALTGNPHGGSFKLSFQNTTVRLTNEGCAIRSDRIWVYGVPCVYTT